MFARNCCHANALHGRTYGQPSVALLQHTRAVWAANTAYTAGQFVFSNIFIYQVTHIGND